MVAAELIDEHVPVKQCKLAVEALLKHEKRREEKQQDSQLLPGKEQHVWLQVTVKQMHPEKKLKPHKIPVAHPIVDPRTSPVCLITKDPQREYKDLLETNNIRFISRVVGVTKLKGKFKPFEARRLLLKENDLFLADERVVPLLPGLLGKKFFEAKKQPIPVCLTRKDLKGELERAISSTYFHQNQGTCSSIKIGTVSQSNAHVLANLQTALPAVVKAIKGGWDNIQSLHIKTSTSTSLPIWSCELGADAGGRWDGLVGAEQSDSEAGSDDDKSADEVPEVEVKKATKGKKRAAEGEEEQPKKKAKASAVDTPAPVTDGPTKSKKRKAAKGGESPQLSVAAASAKKSADPVASEGVATPKAQEGKKKRKDQSAQPEPSSSSSAIVAEATTPSPSSKKARAQAADFFEEEQAASGVVPPPSTPADGLKAGQKKKRKAAVEQTPVSGAISKLAEEAHASPAPADKKASKKAKGKQPEPVAAAAAGAEVEVGEKKSKKKAKEDDKTAEPTVSVQDVKRKLRASTVEKKEKGLKAKRSAKETLIGRKGL